MNASARTQRIAIVIATIAVVVAAFLVTPPSSESATWLNPETTAPGGGAAIARGVERLGLGGDVVRETWTSWCEDHPGAVLAVIAPTASMEPESLESLLAWIDGGGTLIYVPGMATTLMPRTDVELSDALGFTMRTAARDPEDRTRPRVIRATEGRAPLRELGLEGAPEQWSDWLRAARTDAEVVGEPAEVWLQDHNGLPSVALFERGEGRVFLWCDAEGLRNDRQEAAGYGASFLRSIAVVAQDRPVFVDGYGHGLAALGDLELALWRWSTGTRLGNTALFALAIGLLAMVVAGVRVAPPIPDPPPPGRSPLEHVNALADAYRRAGAHRRPTEHLLSTVERRLGSVGLATRLASLRRSRPDLAKELDRVERASKDPGPTVTKTNDLVALCAALDLVATADTAPPRPNRNAPRNPRD
ncbi:DUF4350 domain-containing protein [Engelhardtia mirabilis]|uniref:DUF4350 domain-containing protein n=1 Tax=Engelhardtia mirabilis TaxID=2528011 RepID=A0A518BNN1_9BACT|nr:hypothetical protein Pla133_36890 [Planctomycetes bacterium Pla133]QDV02915.1 hypothetical protein Pla86_36870 [Planctomycetes bacterium Pla86]